MKKKNLMMLAFLILLLPSFSYAGIPGAFQPTMGTMKGVVYVDGKPVPYAIIAFFDTSKGLPPVGSGVSRLPDFVDRADAQGEFQVNLSEGQYNMGILPRSADQSTGPPRPGETFYFASDDKKRLRKLTVEASKEIDVGQVNALKRPDLLMASGGKRYFIVEGTVIDGVSNKPYPGARVLAKRTPDHGKPDFFGAPTGKDGKFSLKLPVGTLLYLIAREEITGFKPGPGDKIGTFGITSAAGISTSILASGPKGVAPGGVNKLDVSNADHGVPVSGKKGQVLSGLIIQMYEIPDHQENQENAPKQTGAMFK